MNITYAFELNSKPGRDGLHTVLLRITASRKHRRIKTTVAVKPAEFDKDSTKERWIKSANRHHKEFN